MAEHPAAVSSAPVKTTRHAILATLLITACEAKPTTTSTSSGASAESPSVPAVSAAAPAPNPTTSAAPLAAASSTASPPVASASAAPTSAVGSVCAEGARKDDDARYCITLPAKRLAVSYEGDSPGQGIIEELEIAGDRVVIKVGPARAGDTVASLKKAALERIGASLVESGDLSNGYWTDLKSKDGARIINSAVVSKYLITCTHWVADEKNVETARAVCKSLKTF